MYPSRFSYLSPSTLDDAMDTLSRYGDEAKILAGGMSLIPLMKLRFADPELLVDLGRAPGLTGLEETERELRIGALVRHATSPTPRWSGNGRLHPWSRQGTTSFGVTRGARCVVHSRPPGVASVPAVSVRGRGACEGSPG
ncbi:MAG: FAD binding domain-containing protein [Streptomycetales bacterium]